MDLQDSFNNGTTNITPSDPRSTVEVTFQALTMCLIMLASLVGNSLIIIAIYMDRTLQNVTNVFVVNLACADFLLALLGMPFTLVSSITYDWKFGTIWCDINGMANSLFCVASMLTLAAVSIDRFIAIVRPLRYTSYMTSKTAGAMIVYIWLHSLLIALLPIMGWSEYTFLKNESICTVFWDLDISLTIFIFVLCFFFPFAIMIFTYSRVLNAAWKQSKRLVPMTGRFSEKKKPARNESSTFEPISIGSAESMNQQSQSISTGLPTPLSTDGTMNGGETQTKKASILVKDSQDAKSKEKTHNVNSATLKMSLCLANKTKLPEHIDKPLKTTQDFISSSKISIKDDNTKKDAIITAKSEMSSKIDDYTMQMATSRETDDQHLMFEVPRKNKTIVHGNSINANEPCLQLNTNDNNFENNVLPTRNCRRVVTDNDAKPDYEISSQCSLEISDDYFNSFTEETILTDKIQQISIKSSSLNRQDYQNLVTQGERADNVENISTQPLYDLELQLTKKERKVSVTSPRKYNLAPLRNETRLSISEDVINSSSCSDDHMINSNNNNNSNIDDSHGKIRETREQKNFDNQQSVNRTPQLVIDSVETPSHSAQNTPRTRRITVTGCYTSTKNNYGIQNGSIKHLTNSTPNLQRGNSSSSLRVDTRNDSNPRQRKVSAFRLRSPNIKALRRKKPNTNGIMKMKQENKAVRTLLIVVGTFVLCWLPHFIGIFCILTRECTWPDRYFAITTWLAMSNSGCNPVIYGAMSRQFRRRFKQILQCKRGFF